MLGKNIDEKTIAKKMIISSLKIESSLVNILNAEAKILSKKLNNDIEYAELQKTNKTCKYIIYFFNILDERIQKCLDILNSTTDKKD